MAFETTHISLLERLTTGSDPQAWDDFCERYGLLIRGFARRQSLQVADCDEVVQEVLLGLTQSLPNFRYDPNKGKFRSYLKTITQHAIYKRRQRQSPVATDPSTGVLDTTPEAQANSEAEAMWEQEWRQYHLRLASRSIAVEFNETDRRAFDLYAIQGQSVNETATHLGLSVDQVYQAKSRILKRLSSLIQQQVEEEG